MRVSTPSFLKPHFSKSWLNKVVKVAFNLCIIGILGLIAFVIYHHFKRPASLPVAASPSAVENVSKSSADNSLKNKDYASYQFTQVDNASLYFDHNDINNAERIMQEVLQNVPADKVTASSYGLMAGIQKAKGDNAQYKHYLQLLIPKLQAEGRTQEVTYYQGQLSKL